jgi:hypothetical protein
MSARPTESVVELRYGLWLEGRSYTSATIRALSGAEEMLLAELDEAALPAERATLLLASTVQAIGDLKPVTAQAVRELTIGDRERLLLMLHAISFGRLDTTVRCPSADCGELLELPLDPRELVQSSAPTGTALPPEHDIDIQVNGQTVRVRFRLPNGADQELAAREALHDVDSAAAGLLRACIIEATGPDGRILDPASVLSALRAPLEDAWSQLDPTAQIASTVACPVCNTRVDMLLDAFSLLAAEIRYTDSILVEVHRLAGAYHWTEAEILGLPIQRRRRYLALTNKGGTA